MAKILKLPFSVIKADNNQLFDFESVVEEIFSNELFLTEKSQADIKSIFKKGWKTLSDTKKLKKIMTGDFNLDEVDEGLMSKFLLFRSYGLAYIVFFAASRSKQAIAQDVKTISEIDDVIESLISNSITNDWDWVSYNELEFDLFKHLAELSHKPNLISMLNQVKHQYLTNTLSLNKKFWRMKESADFYKELWFEVETRNADQARDMFIEYFRKNDRKILYHYFELTE